jgi:hypothetical protein
VVGNGAAWCPPAAGWCSSYQVTTNGVPRKNSLKCRTTPRVQPTHPMNPTMTLLYRGWMLRQRPAGSALSSHCAQKKPCRRTNALAEVARRTRTVPTNRRSIPVDGTDGRAMRAVRKPGGDKVTAPPPQGQAGCSQRARHRAVSVSSPLFAPALAQFPFFWAVQGQRAGEGFRVLELASEVLSQQMGTGRCTPLAHTAHVCLGVCIV